MLRSNLWRNKCCFFNQGCPILPLEGYLLAEFSSWHTSTGYSSSLGLCIGELVHCWGLLSCRVDLKSWTLQKSGSPGVGLDWNFAKGMCLFTGYANCFLAGPGSEKVGNPMPLPGHCSDSGYHVPHFEPALGMSSHSPRPDTILLRSSLTLPQLSTKSF